MLAVSRAGMGLAQQLLLLVAVAAVLVAAEEKRWSVEGVVRGGSDDVQVLLQGDEGQCVTLMKLSKHISHVTGGGQPLTGEVVSFCTRSIA